VRGERVSERQDRDDERTRIRSQTVLPNRKKGKGQDTEDRRSTESKRAGRMSMTRFGAPPLSPLRRGMSHAARGLWGLDDRERRDGSRWVDDAVPGGKRREISRVGLK